MPLEKPVPAPYLTSHFSPGRPQLPRPPRGCPPALSDELLLAAHLGGARAHDGLSEVALPPEELGRARVAGYRRFVDQAVRRIERAGEPEAAIGIVERVAARCGGLEEREAWTVLMPVYEAAVRTTSDCRLASRALDRVLRLPE